MSKMKKWIASVLTVCMLLSFVLVGTAIPASALTVTEKPENGTTVGQPFEGGTANSTNFRIPGLVTLDNGRVVATIDARWSWAADAGGIDTLVSVSDDNGANWTYTFANYLGDNGNVANNQSCCFIDPAIATDGTTLYMIADLYPAGFAINSARYLAQAGSTGFDADGNLLLRSDAENNLTFGNNGYETGAKNATYGYYLKDGKIYTTAGQEVSGYTVDAYFNITGNGISTNLFFADSPYKPFPTDFLYMTKSTDGLTWSEPELLNVKAAEEQSYLVGPGNGTYDEASGRVVFTAYRHTGGASGTAYECTSLIWMDRDGNWKRSEDCTTANWSSEASCVVLADGTVRVFYRDGFSVLRYTDMVWDETQQNYVRDPEVTEVSTVAVKKSGCQLTAIKYSQPIDGKDAIIVGTPASTGGRNDGHVYVFLLEDDNSMELVYNYDINEGNESYAYSCLSELNNGDLGLLWESGGAAVTYSVLEMDKVIARENNVNLSFVDVVLDKGESASYTDNTGDYSKDALTGLDTDIAEVTMTGRTEVTNSVRTLGTGASVATEDCLFTFTASGDNYVISRELEDGTTVYLNHYVSSHNNIPLTATSNVVAVTEGDFDDMFQLTSQIAEGGQGAARTLHFHMEAATPYWNRCGTGTDKTIKCQEYLFRPANAGEDTSASPIPGYVQLTSVDQIVDGGQYLIAAKNDAGNWYVLNPTTSSEKLEYVAQVVGQSSVSRTEITITGTGHGYTEVQIGNVVYKIDVTEVLTKDVTLEVGESVTLSDDRGYYVGADTSALDSTVATVDVKGTVISSEKALSQPVTELVSGEQYMILNTRSNKWLSNKPTANNRLAQTGSVARFEEAPLWTLTATNGGYYMQDANGQYLSVASATAALSDSKTVVTITTSPNTANAWQIGCGNQYLNDHNQTDAGGWSTNGDAGSQWIIYKTVDVVTEGTTQVIFTGVKAGKTSVRIGDTIYNVTVTGEAAAYDQEILVGVDQTKTVLDKTGDHSDDVDLSGLNQSIATVTVSSAVTPATRYTAGKVTELVSGKQYVIVNTRANKPVTNNAASAAAAAGAGSGLSLEGNKDSAVDAAIWTITAVDGKYTVQDLSGKYMTVGSNAAGVSSTEAQLTLNYNGSTWTISQDGAYLNHFGGNSSTCAAGWKDGTAAGDAGSQWEIYEVITEPGVPATEITVTGHAVGKTTFRVGSTVYKITVSDEKVYTVTLNHNHSGSEDATISVPAGRAVGELPVPMRQGHTFFGWYLNGSKVNDSFVVTEDVTLTADWITVETKEKPANGNTTGQPFPVSYPNGNAYCYRIPGIVTMDDGTVIAMADQRWTTWADCGGLDTIVSVSKDNGATWTYTYANYMGDNGDVYNPWSTTFIDPAIASDGTTAYMIADLFPAGVSTMANGYASQAGGNSGFDAEGRLALRDLVGDTYKVGASKAEYQPMATSRSYDYYLNPEADGSYTIRKAADDSVVEGYTVDAFFNIKSADGSVDTNLFMADSPYQAYPTNYLYLTTSNDGLTWSAPKLLNLKANDESAFLVGPGSGTYDPNTGSMVFTAYCYNGAANSQRSCLIWMDEEGNWTRSAPATNSEWSSEASAVVLNDGTVRMFFRDANSLLSYTDYQWVDGDYQRDENNVRVTTAAAKNGGNGCMLSAYRYSQPINGKEAVMVATPATSNSRSDGHIYVFLVNEDGSMDLAYDHDITEGSEYYAYSCLTELKAGPEKGSMALFWEDSWTSSPATCTIRYSVITLDEIVNRDNDVLHTYVDVQLEVGGTASYTDKTGDYTNADTSALDTAVATVKMTASGESINAAVTQGSGTAVKLEDCLFTFTASGNYYVISRELEDGTTVYLNHYVSSHNNIPLTATSNVVAVTEGDFDDMFQLTSQIAEGGQGAARTLHFHMEAATPYWNRCGGERSIKCHEYLYRPAAQGEDTTGSDIPGYVRITAVSEIVDGGQYLIAAKNDAGNWYVLYPNQSENQLEYVAKVEGQSSVSSTEITFTGVGEGTTSVQIGDVVYDITVTDTAHTHTFDQKNTDEKYLASAADCEHAATYFFSCSCGEKGTEVFEDGEALGHAFDSTGVCGNCQTEAVASITAGETVTWYLSADEAFAAAAETDGAAVLAIHRDGTVAEFHKVENADVDLIVDSGVVLTLNNELTLAGDLGGNGTIEGSGFFSALYVKGTTGDITVSAPIHNSGTIVSGTFNGEVYNITGTITGGTFNGAISNIMGTIINTQVPTTFVLGEDFSINSGATATIECTSHIQDSNGVCRLCGETVAPKADEVIRLAGEHRWNTAIKVADEMKANLNIEKFDAIIIASGNDFADALAGSYLSTVKNAPILLSWGLGGAFEFLDTDNIDYIKANLAEDGIVYILGGEKAIPTLYETELADFNVKRLGGADRVETNLLILEEAGIEDGDEILVCTATNFADSLSASATGKPILLVFNNLTELIGKQPEFLAGLKDCTFTIIGGKNAVSDKLAEAIGEYGKVERLAGENRFETSVMVAEKYFENPKTAVLAYALNYPDGLCGGSLTFSLKAPLILTMTGYEEAAVEYAKTTGITSGLVLGGDALISDASVRTIFAMDAADEIVVK